MPELPDVEGYRRALAEHLPRRTVRSVEVLDAGVLRNTSAHTFQQRVAGLRFRVPQRHGKWLLLPTDGPTVIVHSGMTGRPYWARAGDAPDRYDRVRMTFARGQLRYADLRKLRGIWLADDDAAVARVLGDLGPDALDVDEAQFSQLLSAARRRLLKTTLTDQSTIAGLGNLLSDELCWQSRIHPLRPCNELDGADLHQLYSTMRRILRTSVRHACVPRLRSWLTGVRDVRGASCPRCGSELRRTRSAGRTAVWCPHDQPR